MPDWSFAFETFQLDPEQGQRLPSLLERLNAPADLVGIAGVFENAKAALALPLMRDVSSLDDVVEDLRLLEELIYRCHAQITPAKKHQRLWRNTSQTELDSFLRGTFDKNPFYSLFYLNSAENQLFFHWLRQFLFTFRQATMQNYGISIGFKEHDFNTISIMMRRLTDENPVGPEWLKKADCQYCPSYFAFIEFLYDLADYFVAHSELPPDYRTARGAYNSEDPRQKNQYFYQEIMDVIKILRITQGFEKKRRTSGPRGGQGPGRDIVSGLSSHGISALTGSALLYPETLIETNGAPDTLYSLLETDYGEDEFDAGEELFEQPATEAFIFAEHEPIEHYITAFHGRRVAGAVRKRVERQHQYLPSSFQSLSGTQLRSILTVCFRAKDYDPEPAKLILLMLFCARHDHGFRASRVTADLSENRFDVVYLREDGWEVGLPAYTINYEHDLRQVDATPLAEGVRLPFPDELVEWLEADISNNQLYRENRLLGDFEQTAGIDIFYRLSMQGELSGISLSQVANHLFIRACQRFGSATATLMFGRPAPGSQARLYYTALPLVEIRARYRELIEEMSASSGVPLTFSQNDDQLPIPSLSLGCRYLPTLQQYVDALAGLRKHLEQLKKSLLTDDQWLVFHNHFTVYSVLCQGLLTGMRPTHHGFIRSSDILHGVDVAVVRDKDTEDEFHSRTIPLHPLAIQIAENYQSHIEAMAGRMHRIGMLQPWHLLQCPTPFFFTNAGRKRKDGDKTIRVAITPFRPKKYADLLAPWIDLPANSHRRFLRSYLDMKRVPAEIIDAYIGHGNLGEHFWHAQSTLSFTDIRQALRPQLDELIRLLDIRAMTGLCS
jgi:hypothetical protein